MISRTKGFVSANIIGMENTASKNEMIMVLNSLFSNFNFQLIFLNEKSAKYMKNNFIPKIYPTEF